VAERSSALEGLVAAVSPGIWQETPVFLTGHTGFKGSWLTLWLARLGAVVTGYALPPETTPSLFELAGVQTVLKAESLADIRDLPRLTAALQTAAPQVVFHLAAQPLVRRSYQEPVATWSTNVMGVVNLLEAVRACPGVKAVVIVTTDKCYENREWLWGYREQDRLGGHDPYSASKAAAELVVHSYRQSFFARSGPLIASVRAGNVIGGGDFSPDRLIPDAARAVARRGILPVRHPDDTRPWQHVLDALHGYLLLAESLLAGERRNAEAFNFGPGNGDHWSVAEVLTRLQTGWPELRWEADQALDAPHEAHCLALDSSKARHRLHWRPRWNLDASLDYTARWYRTWLAGGDVRALTGEQITDYVDAC
jgi:CDP-glucose 4,6-dehydratase